MAELPTVEFSDKHLITLEDFHSYISVLNDLFHSYWRFMNYKHPNLWPLEMGKANWVEQMIMYIEDDQDDF